MVTRKGLLDRGRSSCEDDIDTTRGQRPVSKACGDGDINLEKCVGIVMLKARIGWHNSR